MKSREDSSFNLHAPSLITVHVKFVEKSLNLDFELLRPIQDQQQVPEYHNDCPYGIRIPQADRGKPHIFFGEGHQQDLDGIRQGFRHFLF